MKNIILSKKMATGLILTSALIIFNGCAKYSTQSIDQASQSVTDSLGCTNMKSQVFDSFYELLDKDKVVPSAEVLKESLKLKISNLRLKNHFSSEDEKQLQKIQTELSAVVDLMLSESTSNPALTWKEQVQKIIQYEMQDQSTKQIIQTHQKLESSLNRINQLSSALQISCSTQPNDNVDPQADSIVTTSPNVSVTPGTMSKGLNMVFSTVYQSCRVLDLPAIDKATQDVVGITRLAQNHPDGIGGKRVITDLKSVQNTHYYIRGIASESSCVPIRNNPLIYDYGGEPAISSNTLNFFKDNGTGTEALGVDCSAFVSSAIAVSGLRYKPGLANKPIYTRQTSASFIDASKSGFTCFDNVTVTPKQSIKPGDIVGVNGHVVAVDKVGVDPFGLSLIKKESDCATLNYKNFDISVVQSSPSKNGIGINKYKISDYLDESGKMREAFVQMGVQACLAHFQNKNIKPSSADWGFLRHKGTAECLAPRVTIAGESCTQKCF